MKYFFIISALCIYWFARGFIKGAAEEGFLCRETWKKFPTNQAVNILLAAAIYFAGYTHGLNVGRIKTQEAFLSASDSLRDYLKK